MRVLVVDDEPCIRQLIRGVLATKGYEALEAVITDQVMPGMDGSGLIAHLTAQRYSARYLLISGYSSEYEEAAGLLFFSKPFTVPQLVEALENLVGQATLPELERTWRKAKLEWEDAIAELEGVIMEIPTELPHPDGALLIRQAGQKRKAPYEKYMATFGKYKDALKLGGALGPGTYRTT